MFNAWLKNSCLFLCVLALTGCGAVSLDSQLPDSFVLKEGQTIEFLPVENVTGKTLEPPVDKIFDQHMANLLKDKKLLNTTAQPAHFILKSKLIEYEPGNAFGRWLLPGIGTTVCTVHAELLDKKTGALIGRMESRQTVSVGGAYSIGAHTYICKRVADALMGEIDKKLENTIKSKNESE